MTTKLIFKSFHNCTNMFTKSALPLYAIVFISGAAVMIVEIAGARLVAPFFGSTLFVWSALIGVILGALATGYYIGGKLADRSPRFETLSAIVFLSGMSVAAIPVVEAAVAPLGMPLGGKYGPLFVSLSLFALPSFLMGMVSPYAVKLGTESLKIVGASAGKLYALSTLGSIVGTLLAGFFLIPSFGTHAIIMGTAAVLVLASLIGLIRRLEALSAAVVVIGTVSLALLGADSGALYDRDSGYYRVMVVEEDGVRMLLLDSQVHGGMRPGSDEHIFPYSQLSRLAYLLGPQRPVNALFIGLGPGTQVKDFGRRFPNARKEVVEIDPAVAEVARRYFGVEESASLNIWIEDARRFLAENDERYDYIFVDAFNGRYSVPHHLTTLEAVLEVERHLSPGGVVVINVISSVEGEKSAFFRSEYKTYREVFPTVYVFPVEPERPEEVQNIIMMATREPQLSGSEFARLAERGDENQRRWAANYWQKKIRTDDVPVLTDDYAPTDNLMMPTYG